MCEVATTQLYGIRVYVSSPPTPKSLIQASTMCWSNCGLLPQTQSQDLVKSLKKNKDIHKWFQV